MPFIAPIVAAIGSAIGAVGAALGSIGSFLGGLGVFGKLLITIGLNVASTLIQKAIAKNQKPPPGGVQFERQYGADVPRSVACGLVGVAGHDCYVNTYGSSNKFLQQIYTLSDYPSDGLSRVAINGEWVTLGPTPDVDKGLPVTSGDYANLIWIRFIDGRQTEADSYLIDNSNPEGRWTEDHVGVGETAILVSMTYDQEKNAQFPNFFFEYRGARLYDWRKDSSVGGSGAHRFADPSTHEFSENPIVIEYNYRRGFRVNDDLFCGMGMPAGDLPLDRWAAAANICDETVEDEARYRCSILLDCMSTHGDNIESIALSCGAMTVDGVDGSWPIVGSDQPAVLTFTDDDLITTAPVKYRAKHSQSELVNSVSGNFPDPENLWSMVGYEPQIGAAYVVLDRRTRDLAIDFPQVRSGRQAAQLASIYLYENRYEATATITLRPRFQVLEPGDWVRWNSTRYGNKVYIVTETQLMSLESDGPRNIQVSLQERDGAIYDGVTPPAITVPAAPGAPAYLAEVQDFGLVPVNISGADGRLAPAIRVSWSVIEDTTVSAVEIQYFPTSDPDAVIYRTIPVPTTVAILAEGVVGETEYRVRSRLVTDPARTVTWSAGATVTTTKGNFGIDLAQLGADVQALLDSIQSDIGDNTDAIVAEAAARAADIAAQADALADEVDDRVAAISGQADALAQEVSDRSAAVAGERTDRLEMGRTQALDLRSLRDTVSATALQISDLYLKSATDQVTMRKEIVVSEGNARAYSDSQLTLAVGPTSALAAQLSALQASIAGVDSDLDAAITSLSEAIADGDAGEASARQALELQVRGSYTGTDFNQVTEGLLYNLNQTRISDNEALAQSIELMAAGVSNASLFDWADAWEFDTDAEGWGGNGAPTAAGGYLRPANHATDPYVTSPTGLAVQATKYNQVKASIRRTGSPAWEGYCWYKRTGDSTWDAGRRATLAEPIFDADGNAVITWTMEWDGTIDQIRLDLSSVQDASKYVRIGGAWIGRISPGASQAQVGRVQEALSTALAAEASDREALSTILVGQADPTGLTLPTITGGLVYDEMSARIDGDSALSTLITGVQNSLDDQAGDIDALTTAQTTMQTAIDTLGDQVTLNASNIDDVEASLEGKADAAVTDALSAEIKTMGGGAVASQVGQALRDVRLKLDKLALANFDLFATGQQQRLDLSGALVNVQQALTGRIDTTDGSLSLLGQAVTAIQLALPDYATLDVTNILDGRVTATESSLTSAGSAITAIQAELPNKASVSAVEAAQDAADAAQADADAANMLASTKADATALDSLAATVSSQGGTITSQGSALTSLSNSLEATNGNVTAARSAADAAQAAANAAQTSADSKSDVLFQSATPGAGYQNGKTLWIDTAGNANTPKRWNGSNWVTATDKVATDAAAAATSAQAAADAANALAATKASTTVTDDLQSQITSGAGGSTALAQTLRAVKASIDRLALSQFDLFTGGAQQRINLANIVASVNQSLTSRVDVTDGNVAVVVGRVDKLDAAIPGLATLGVTDALAGRIDVTEAGLEQVGESLLEINNTLDGKADATLLNDYYTKTQTDGVATTAASNATTALASSLAPQIAAAQAAADDAGNLAAANASALLNTYTKTETDGAVATAIAGVSTDFQSKVDDVSAAGKFRVATQATSAGAETTIGLIAEATSGATTHTAGLLIDALSSGKSRIIALGDQFVFADPDDLDNLVRAIIFEDGKAYLDGIYVRYLKADQVEVDGSFDAGLILQRGSVLMDQLGYDAVADKTYGNLPLTGSLYYTDWTDVLVLPCDNPNPAAVLIEYSLTAVAARAQSGSGVAVAIVRLIRKDSGGGVEELARVQANGPALSSDTQTNGRMIMDLNGTRGSSYRIQLLSSGATGGSSWKAAGYIKLAWNKR